MKERTFWNKFLFPLLLALTSAVLFFLEYSYGAIREYLCIYINLVFFVVFWVLNHKGKKIWLFLLILYSLFLFVFYFTLPEKNYRQAVTMVQQSEGIDCSVDIVSPRFYRNRFKGWTDSGAFPTKYYVVVFENQPELLYYIDPYTEEYAAVELK